MCQSNCFQNECCSITSRRAVMCKLNLVTLQCVSVKLLSMLLVKKNRVWHFADGPLGLVSQTPAHLDQCILYRAEESLFWGNLACSSFSTSLEKKRGVICVLKTICSRVIDPEKSNLSISCQLYRTPKPKAQEYMLLTGGFKELPLSFGSLFLCLSQIRHWVKAAPTTLPAITF